MEFAIVFTFAVLVAVMAGLMLTRIAPDMVLLGGLVLLVVVGVVSPRAAFAGFGNEGLATIGALFVVAEGLRQTGALAFVGPRVLGQPKTEVRAQVRLMLPVAILSAFLNNTPLVAMMLPIVHDWARRCRISVSRLLLPLSYASILGGLITLVGTSTTLVVNGLLLDTPGQRSFTMFELAWVGVPATVVGMLYIPLAARWLLPDRRPVHATFEDPREYTLEMLVSATSPIAERTIGEAGLRSLPGMFLMEILRDKHVVVAPGPDTRIRAHDRLVFVGVLDSVRDLQKIPGLTPAADQLFKIDQPRSHRCLVEAVVSASSRFSGMTIKDAKFRTHYNAVIIAVGRHGERVAKKIGDIVLQAGDTLLLETHPSFADVQRNSRDFYLVSRVEDSTPVLHERAWLARVILFVMVGLVAFGVTSMLRGACLAGGAMVVTRCLRVSQAKRSIDVGVLLGVGAGLGIGAAMEASGAADLVARWIVEPIGDAPLLALAAIYLVTNILANLITTKAAAVLVFPVALATAQALDVSFMPFAIGLTVAAASAYATPVGYQTNLMVYGPGGYRSRDYLWMGAPLSLLVFGVAMVVIPFAWPL